MPPKIEFHTAGEWTAVYLDGVLVRVGDTYLADEWLHEHFGVVDVDDDAFMRGQHGRDGVAKTLDEVVTYVEERDSKRTRAAALRQQARFLEDEAKALDAS